MQRCIWLFIAVASIAVQPSGSFDCRRNGVACLHGGTCDAGGSCSCTTDRTHFDCSLRKSEVTGSADCDPECDHGTCIKVDDGSTDCSCDVGWSAVSRTDNRCSAGLHKVICLPDRMIVNLNPYAYAKMYAWDKPECDFDLNHNGMNPDRTEFVGGRGKDIPHSGDSKCGSIVPVTETIGDTQYTVYKRDFVIQHNEDFTSSLDEIVTAMCYFDASGISVTSDISTVSLAKANLGSTSIKEEFSPVTLSLQVDDAIPGNSVNVGQKLSFTLTVGSEFSELFLKEVKLDNGKPEADDMYQSFKILENGCKSTTKGKDVWIAHPTHPDGDNQVVLFEVKAFVFTKATVLKAIFTTKVCATSDSSCDATDRPKRPPATPQGSNILDNMIDCSGQQSSGRRKRSTDDGTNNTYVIDETVRVIYPGRKGVSVTKTGERRQEEGCETSSAMIGTVAALAGVVFLLVVLLLALVVRSFRRNNRNSRADKMDGVISPYFTKDSQ